jgi:hypothetical protein
MCMHGTGPALARHWPETGSSAIITRMVALPAAVRRPPAASAFATDCEVFGASLQTR